MIHQAPPPVEYRMPAPTSSLVSYEVSSRYEPTPFHSMHRSATDRSKYTFRYTWFEQVRPGWEQLTASLVGQPVQVLEVGSFEGCSTTWLMDYLLDHDDARITAIDSFGGGNESAPSEYDIANLEQRFLSNVALSKNASKLRVLKGQSFDRLMQLRGEGQAFDLIYIDGSHVAYDVLQDAMLVWPMLKEGGTLVFDDYHWDLYKQDFYCPNLAINAFLRVVAPTVEWFEHAGQLWAKKVPNSSPPERK